MAVAGRVCSRTFVAVTLLWVVALVGWPERTGTYCVRPGDSARVIAEDRRAIAQGVPVIVYDDEPADGRQECWWVPIYYCDADLHVLADALAP